MTTKTSNRSTALQALVRSKGFERLLIVTAVVAVLVASGVAMPLVRTVTTIWVNRRTSSDVRATVHSFLAQAEYGGEILCAGSLALLSGVVGAGGTFACTAGLFAASMLVIGLGRRAELEAGAHG